MTAALGAVTCGASAYEVPLSFFGSNTPPIDVHGFLSQGYLLSSDYNYLANDTKNGSFQFTEMGLNASMNPFPRTRIAIQGFDFDVGNVGQYDPILDYALAEYTFSDEVGVRGGRIRRPSGIYNSIQDIDLARTFVLLPQGMYDARWRDWSAGLDGVDAFGNLSLHKAGSVSYEAYAGYVEMADNGGVSRYAENGYRPYFKTTGMDSTKTFGGQLWYNTPLDGLRVGASLTYMSDFGLNGNTLSPISPDLPLAPTTIHAVGNVLFQQYSLEYVWKDWTFQAEYYTYTLSGWSHAVINEPPFANNQQVLQSFPDSNDTWYIAASHRFNHLLEVGTYYTQYKDSSNGLWQNDAALSFRFDLKDWWIFKIEGHYIEGTGLLRDNTDNPNINPNSGWFMLAVKTTVSF